MTEQLIEAGRKSSIFDPFMLPTSMIADVSVEKYFLKGDHYEFTLIITGRSRFFHSNTSGMITYKQEARYSKLRELHKALEKELTPYIKAGAPKMPDFPGRAWLTSAKKKAEKRVILLNNYFAKLFQYYYEVVSNSSLMINFF